jgi:hypothetical protein
MLGVGQRSRPHGGAMAQPILIEEAPTFGERVLRLRAQCGRKVAAQRVWPKCPWTIAPAGARRCSCRVRQPCRSIPHRPCLAASALIRSAIDEGFEYRATPTLASQPEAPGRARCFAFETYGSRPFGGVRWSPGKGLVFGHEAAGLPTALRDRFAAEQRGACRCEWTVRPEPRTRRRGGRVRRLAPDRLRRGC